MATLKFYELENGKWENAKAEDSKSKIYFAHVLRSRWGIETQSDHAGNSFWVLSGKAKLPSNWGRNQTPTLAFECYLFGSSKG